MLLICAFRMGRKYMKGKFESDMTEEMEKGIPLSEIIAIEQAKQLSSAMALSGSYHLQKHLRKLDRLCKVNGLKRISVQSDGYCLINAVIMQLTPHPNKEIFLKQLCNHFTSTKTHYIPYLLKKVKKL